MFTSRPSRWLVAVLPAIVFLSLPVSADDGGALSSRLLENLRDSYNAGGNTAAVHNALAANDANKLAVDWEKLSAHNTLFNHVIKTKGITNQQASGRCWLFAGLNVLRPAVIEKLNLGSFEISPSYLFFWDKLEKANTFLEAVIDTRERPVDDRTLEILFRQPCPDGGWWSYVVDLIEKYGVAPVEVMPETYASSHTGNLNKLLTRKLRQDAARLRQLHQEGMAMAQLRAEKETMLRTIYRILALSFGEPPRDFIWRYETADSVVSEPKRYSPLEFYSEVISLGLPDYVSIFDYPGKEYYKLYQIEYSRNIHDRENVTFINLPIDSLKRYSLSSVLENEPIWFACDVGKSHYSDKGILREGIFDFSSLYDANFGLEKQLRLEFRDSSPNHAMVFTGVDTAAGAAVKWKVENSWGKDRGDGGYWTLYDDWFGEYVYIVIVDRKRLAAETLAILEQKPELLPPWDPMWEFARGVFSPAD